jgi:hypothetical protein
MGDFIEEKILGNFGYVALGLFIIVLLLMSMLEMPSRLVAVVPETEMLRFVALI